MRVAPVKRGRAVILGRLSDLPMEIGEVVAGEFVADKTQPAWLSETSSIATTPWYRFASALDDVLFTGWALWSVERDESGAITDADYIERSRWKFDATSPTGVAWAFGTEATGLVWMPVTDPRSVVLFAGPDDGLLESAQDSIRGWRHMERAWVGRVRNPIPLIVIEEKEQNGATPDEAKAIVDAFASARTSPNGAVGFLPAKYSIQAMGEAKADLFNEGRNAARIDIANHMNLPVSYLDGSTATSSLTYVTQEGDRHALIDDLEYWLTPFEARLSEADVTGAAGKVIRFNRSNLTATPNDPHGAEAPRDDAPAQENAA
ncbi:MULTISPECIES: phage portal protein [unclassified Microbacterium]|uniref:phage portal protein n=1 Tax=unclassified Microbacterium TaxID=2609290 RepID=UPI003019BBED